MHDLAARPDLAPITDTAVTLHRAGLAGPATAVVLALSAVERAAGRGDTAAWVAWQGWQVGRTVELAHATDARILELARYVRTQAGAKRYGQPIGSLITRKGRKSRALSGGERTRRALDRRKTRTAQASRHADALAAARGTDARQQLGQLTQPQIYAVRARLRDADMPAARRRAALDRVDKELARRVTARVRNLDDDALDKAMRRSAERGRLSEFDRYVAEIDRREDARANQQEARKRRAAAQEEKRAAEYERLLDEGYSDEDAVADAYGVSVDKQRRQEALRLLRADGFGGKGLTQAARRAYKADVRNRYLAAEDETRGHMLSKAGQAAGVDPLDLFVGPEARARKHASDELKAWWDEHGRPTFDEYLAQITDDPQAASRARNSRSDFLR